jgi:arylamine N-acetyltransferase
MVRSRAERGHALDDALAESYLALLGVDARPGAVDAPTLAALQRAHVARVPYENLDIVRGRPPGIDPIDCVRRIVAGRGGYCFHLNGAFALLLEWLGVELTRHLAGVQGRHAAVPPGANGNHLGLTARVDGVTWLVDVGTGDGPVEPVPLEAGTYEQEGFLFTVTPSPLTPGGWRLHHDPRGTWILFDVASCSVTTAAFGDMHVKLSTSPDSGFVRLAAVMRRTAAHVEILRGCVYTDQNGTTEQQRDVETEEDWWGLVLDHFGLAYGDLTPSERGALWRRVRATHDAWVAGGRA